MINYVCKYAPVELFKGFGQECAVLEEMPENFDKSDKIAHANLCGIRQISHTGCARGQGRGTCASELL